MSKNKKLSLRKIKAIFKKKEKFSSSFKAFDGESSSKQIKLPEREIFSNDEQDYTVTIHKSKRHYDSFINDLEYDVHFHKESVPAQVIHTTHALKHCSFSWLVGSTAHALYQACVKKEEEIVVPNDVDVLMEKKLQFGDVGRFELDKSSNSIVYKTYSLSDNGKEYITTGIDSHIWLADFFIKTQRDDKTYHICYYEGGDDKKEYELTSSRIGITIIDNRQKKYMSVDLFVCDSVTDYIQNVPLVHDGIAIKTSSLSSSVEVLLDEDGTLDSLFYITSPEYVGCDPIKNEYIFGRHVSNKTSDAAFKQRLIRKGFSDGEIDDIMKHTSGHTKYSISSVYGISSVGPPPTHTTSVPTVFGSSRP